MPFQLISPGLGNGRMIPTIYTADGANMSPPLAWRDVPDRTQQLAIIFEDPDGSEESSFVHWVAFAIPPDLLGGLPPGLPKTPRIDDLRGIAQGQNGFKQIGYDGPAPPPGAGPHRYRFQIFALDRPLKLQADADHEALRAAMQGSVLARAALVGTYERNTDIA